MDILTGPSQWYQSLSLTTQLIILLVFLPLGISAIYAWLSLAPWLPSRKKDLSRINTLADLQKGQSFIELGCGNARVCSAIARMNPEVHVVGIELALPMYLWAKARSFFGPKNMTILFGDALKHNISSYDVIYVFGITQTVNKKIKDYAQKQIKPTAKLMSYIFPIHNWKGKSQTHQKDKKQHAIHVYTK